MVWGTGTIVRGDLGTFHHRRSVFAWQGPKSHIAQAETYGPAQHYHLDANYRRAPRQSDLASSQVLSTAVHASGCASLLLYFLLYGAGV
jgi:hypothetical protein